MVTVIVPAYNEEKNIRPSVVNLINAAKRAGTVKLEVIVVNDASTDKTAEVISDLEQKYPDVSSIHHKTNSGIGTGLREALAIAKYPKFMIIPGDNDANPKLLTAILKDRNKADVLFSYYVNKEDRGRVRNLISTLYGVIYMFTFNVFVQYLNGVSLYPTKKLRSFTLKSTRFSITAEINIKLLRSGCSYYEIAGTMQTGLNDSTSISLTNIIEAIGTYFKLVYEIYVEHAPAFNHTPRRVLD